MNKASKSANNKHLLNFSQTKHSYQPLKVALNKLIKQSKTEPQLLQLFILIGQPESGKKTFIHTANSPEITHKLALHPKLEQCTLTLHASTVWLIIPGDHLVQLNKENIDNLCLGLKKCLSHFKPLINLNSITILLDSYDMLTRSKFSNQTRLKQINQFIIALNYIYEQAFGLNVLLNKCDLIPGFCEFFSNRDKEFKEQAWGFPLNNIDKNSLDNAFDLLIKQLNQQLFWCLRQEARTEALALIKEFPIKIEQLKARLVPLLSEQLHELIKLHHAKLNDLFFISCQQYSILESSETTLPIQQTLKTQGYFIKQAYENIIRTKSLNKISKHWPAQKMAYSGFVLLCTAIVAGCLILLTHELSHNIKQTHSKEILIHDLIAQLSNQTSSDIKQSTEQLLAIKQLLTQPKTKHIQFPGSQYIFHHQAKKQEQLSQLKQLYQQYITQHWLPSLTSYLQDYVTQQLNTNPETSYIAFKIYLLLTETQHDQLNNTQLNNTQLNNKQISYIIQHIGQIIPALPKEINSIFAQLEPSSTNYLPDIDTHFINTTRAYFSKLHRQELAYIILFANIATQNSIDLNHVAQNRYLNTNNEYTVIPAIYTRAEFNNTFDNAIPAAAKAALNGNAVLGPIANTKQIPTNTFTKQLKQQYLSEYKQTWEAVLNHTQLNLSTQLDEFSAELASLSSANSGLLRWLKLIYINTHIADIEQQSINLRQLNQLFSVKYDKTQHPLFNSFMVIRQLAKSLQAINQSATVQQTAYEQLKLLLSTNNINKKNNNLANTMTQLTQLSNSLPTPLRLWLLQIKNNYFNLLATISADYINQLWRNTIAEPFHQNFSKQYPLRSLSKETSTSNQALDITQFNQFFARNGSLDQFEQDYLLPLLIQNQQGWVVNPSIANSLSIPTEVLQQLQNYAKIQANYFGKHSTSSQIDFNAYTDKLPKSVASVTITTTNNNTQPTKLSTDKTQASLFSWPTKPTAANTNINADAGADKDILEISIHLADSDSAAADQIKTFRFNGPWAWLKAIDQYGHSLSNNNNSSSKNKIIQLILPIDNNQINNNQTNHNQTKVMINLVFTANNQFVQDLLRNTWMPYWLFKINTK